VSIAEAIKCLKECHLLASLNVTDAAGFDTVNPLHSRGKSGVVFGVSENRCCRNEVLKDAVTRWADTEKPPKQPWPRNFARIETIKIERNRKFTRAVAFAL